MKSFLFLLFVLCSQLLSAQIFTETPPAAPFEGLLGSSIAFSDVNGDGTPDLLITGYICDFFPVSILYTNDGDGNFTEIPDTPFEGVGFGSVAFSDVNGDSTSDVLITGQNDLGDRIAKLYTNDGNGNFTEMSVTQFEGVWRSSGTFSDVNGDGTLDVLITGQNDLGGRISKLYTNDGDGNFTEMQDTPFEGVNHSSVAFSDVNGDSIPDVFILGEIAVGDRIAKLYTNDGDGNFSELPNTPFEDVNLGPVAFSDVNGDGTSDVFLTVSGIPRFYTNDGMGAFTELQGTPFQNMNCKSVAFSDVNGDNTPDVLITGRQNFIVGFPITKLYTNDGTGIFTEMEGTPFEDLCNGPVAFSDVNGDGISDVFLTGETMEWFFAYQSPISKIYINDGFGYFSEFPKPPFAAVRASSIAFSDINGDGKPDVLITGSIGGPYVEDPSAKLYTNDGTGTFTEMEGTPFEEVSRGSVAFSDVNGDSTSDVLITGQNDLEYRISKLYTNDGDGNFTEMQGIPFEGVSQSSVAFSDVNGDNTSDVLITGQNDFGDPISKLYTSDGDGNFTELPDTPFEGVGNGSVAFSDVNGDETADLLITGENGLGDPIAKLYTNDGDGNFTEMADTPFEGVGYSSVAFSDVNGDETADVLITGENDLDNPIAKLYTNDGDGNFTEMSDTLLEGVSRSSVAFSDVNNDGISDVLITGEKDFGDPVSRLYTNDGDGNFTEMSDSTFERVSGGSVAFSDVNGDGNSDVLLTGANCQISPIAKLYINVGMFSFVEDLPAVLDLKFALYPNPSKTNWVNVSVNSSSIRSVAINIFDLNGRLLNQQYQQLIYGLNIFSIDVSILNKGIYAIQLNDGLRQGVNKLVIQ